MTSALLNNYISRSLEVSFSAILDYEDKFSLDCIRYVSGFKSSSHGRATHLEHYSQARLCGAIEI